MEGELGDTGYRYSVQQTYPGNLRIRLTPISMPPPPTSIPDSQQFRDDSDEEQEEKEPLNTYQALFGNLPLEGSEVYRRVAGCPKHEGGREYFLSISPPKWAVRFIHHHCTGGLCNGDYCNRWVGTSCFQCLRCDSEFCQACTHYNYHECPSCEQNLNP